MALTPASQNDRFKTAFTVLYRRPQQMKMDGIAKIAVNAAS
jgi:hypothetical protein